MTMVLEEGGGLASRLGRVLPPGKTRYPLYRRLGGPQGRSGQVRKISPPVGFDPRTLNRRVDHKFYEFFFHIFILILRLDFFTSIFIVNLTRVSIYFNI